MPLTRPMPDELAVAHEGRLAVLNDCVEVYALYDLLEAELAERGLDPLRFPKLHQLALVSGLPPHVYARLHTLLPATRVDCRDGDDAPHGTETSRQSKARIRRSPQTMQAYCCTTCVEEDLREWGFSWFRRFHHIRGFDWCPVHRHALSAVDSPHAFRKVPHQWLQEGGTSPIEIAEDELVAGSVLDRYVAIYMALLDRDRPVLRSVIRPKLVAAAKIRGLATSTKPNLFRLSDLVAEVVPARWLTRHIASWPLKVPRMFLQHVDVPLRGANDRAAADALVLAAAVLSSAGEGIGLLTGSLSASLQEAPDRRAPAGDSGEVMVV